MMKVLGCMIMVCNMWAVDFRQLQSCISDYGNECGLWTKDFHQITNIHIQKSKLLSKKYIALDEACKKWQFNEHTLQEFFLISQTYETKGYSYHIFDQLPCVIGGSFTLDNIKYSFEIQAGGSFEIIDENNKAFYLGCDERKNKKCEEFLP